MNSKDYQILIKILDEICIIDEMIQGYDIAAHKYQTQKMEDIDITVTNDLPNLKK